VVITLAIQYFCWSVGVYGFVIRLPFMIVLVGWLNGVTAGSGASFLFMAVALLVSVVLTLMPRSPSHLEAAKPCSVSPRRGRLWVQAV
jgi:hypothetical protein